MTRLLFQRSLAGGLMSAVMCLSIWNSSEGKHWVIDWMISIIWIKWRFLISYAILEQGPFEQYIGVLYSSFKNIVYVY